MRLTASRGRSVKNRRNPESGQAIVESCFHLFLFFFILVALLDIFSMIVTRIMTDYSSYIASRARSLGYNDGVINRKTRLAAVPASGNDISSVPAPALANWYNVNARAADYSVWDDSGFYGVRFKYWYAGDNSSNTRLSISTSENGATDGTGYVTSYVNFINYPLLPYEKYFISNSSGVYSPTTGSMELKNHSTAYLQ